jgi:zinc/manganese transport system permease protein
VLAAALIGLTATWGGILLAYDSFYWTPGHGWPVSFFVVTLIFLFYVLAGRTGRGGRRDQAVGEA